MMLEVKSFFALRLHGYQHIFFAALAGTFGAVTDWRWMLSELLEAGPSGFQLIYYRFSSLTPVMYSSGFNSFLQSQRQELRKQRTAQLHRVPPSLRTISDYIR